jgi:hypothetical protein
MKQIYDVTKSKNTILDLDNILPKCENVSDESSETSSISEEI